MISEYKLDPPFQTAETKSFEKVRKPVKRILAEKHCRTKEPWTYGIVLLSVVYRIVYIGAILTQGRCLRILTYFVCSISQSQYFGTFIRTKTPEIKQNLK